MHIRMATLGVALVALVAAAPAFAQKPEPASKAAGSKEIKVVGCVQWEKDFKQAHKYVLTVAQVQGPGGRTAAASTGTSGNAAGKTPTEGAAYGITGERAKELGRRIGQQIEVIGTLEARGDPNSERAGGLPRIKMTAWVPLKDFCPAQ